jgi:hypothetical protein
MVVRESGVLSAVSAVKEEVVVVAKGKLLKSRLLITKEKRKALAPGAGAGCWMSKSARNAAPPSARKESPPHLVAPGAS